MCGRREEEKKEEEEEDLSCNDGIRGADDTETRRTVSGFN